MLGTEVVKSDSIKDKCQTSPIRLFTFIKMSLITRCWWFMAVNLVTQEAKIGRIAV
jgi:hypothetical protein